MQACHGWGPRWSQQCQGHHGASIRNTTTNAPPKLCKGGWAMCLRPGGPPSHSHHPLPVPNRGPAVLASRGFWDVRLSAPKPEKSQAESVGHPSQYPLSSPTVSGLPLVLHASWAPTVRQAWCQRQGVHGAGGPNPRRAYVLERQPVDDCTSNH